MANASLSTVLQLHRERVIAAWSERVDKTIVSSTLSHAELLDRMPSFVDEVIRALHPEAIPLPPTSENAEEHGAQRFRLGFDVGEVVREYGVLIECIYDLAADEHAQITPRDHLVISKWVNRGIAAAIAEYGAQRDLEVQRQASEHLGFIAHELRNPLNAAAMAVRRLRRDDDAASPGQRWLATIDRHIRRASELIEATLSEAALKQGIVPRTSAVEVDALLRDLQTDLEAEALARDIVVVVAGEERPRIEADPRLLRSALANLLYNAIKFSRQGRTVTMTARRDGERLLIEIADACGGLPPGKAEELFAPFVQKGENRTGFGLGLAIARQAAEAHNGTIKVRDVPGIGCVFSLDLPIVSPPGR